MEDITLKEIFEDSRKKKISYNINEKTLEMIDDLAKTLGLNRTSVLDAIIFSGIKSQINYMIKNWEKIRKDKDYENKKEKIDELLKKIKYFKKKWTIDEIPS